MHQQFAGLLGIADGFEFYDFDLDAGRCRRKTPRNFLGLGKRHGALARADPQ
jgi:hypothetical protein